MRFKIFHHLLLIFSNVLVGFFSLLLIISIESCTTKKQLTSTKKQLTSFTESLSSIKDSDIYTETIQQELNYLKFRNFLKNLIKKTAFIHPYVAPFPIVLLILSPIFYIINLRKSRLEFSWMWKFCLWGGWIGSVLSAISNYFAATKNSPITNFQYSTSGELVFWLSTLTLTIKVFTVRWESQNWTRILLAIFLSLTGFMALYTSYLLGKI